MPGEKLITLVVPQGRGVGLIEALYERKVLRAALGSARAPFTYAKRTGMIPRIVRQWVEKDILSVVVPAEQAEELFGFLYDKAGVGEAAGAFMYMGALSSASGFSLPSDLPPG